MIVVSDTGPLCYLSIIGHIDALPQLYGQVVIPVAVAKELQRPKSPADARALVEHPPQWLVIREVGASDLALADLGFGEQEAIMLAQYLHADLLLCDDMDARNAARARDIRVVGTLGVLVEAANAKILELPETLNRLRATNFRISDALIQQTLSEHTHRPG